MNEGSQGQLLAGDGVGRAAQRTEIKSICCSSGCCRPTRCPCRGGSVRPPANGETEARVTWAPWQPGAGGRLGLRHSPRRASRTPAAPGLRLGGPSEAPEVRKQRALVDAAPLVCDLQVTPYSPQQVGQQVFRSSYAPLLSYIPFVQPGYPHPQRTPPKLCSHPRDPSPMAGDGPQYVVPQAYG